MIKVIITLKEDGSTEQDLIEYAGEMMSYLDANYSFNSEIVKDCYCDNGIFYFTKDNQLKDSQICGNCKGKGVVGFDYDSKTDMYVEKKGVRNETM